MKLNVTRFGICSVAALLVSGCTHKAYVSTPAPCADLTKEAYTSTLGEVEERGVHYFQNKVPLDEHCITLTPQQPFYDHNAPDELKTNDTERVQQALNALARIDRDNDGNAEGGVLYLRKSDATQNKYRLAQVTVPSNIRIVVDPEVTIVMSYDEVGAVNIDGSGRNSKNSQSKTSRNERMFTIGQSSDRQKLIQNPVTNVEITSSRDGEKFTIDQRTEFPTKYFSRLPGELRANGPQVFGDDAQERGITSVYATPFSIGYARNVAISNVHILDNYTYLPPVMVYPDADMKDGIVNAVRYSGAPKIDANGNKLKKGHLIDTAGNKATDIKQLIRNSTYGRTLKGGAFVNISSERGHGGFGLFQLWAGDTVYLNQLASVGGITVRLEPGAGVENISRSGPAFGSIRNVHMENISIRDGFSAVWLNPHSKDNGNIYAANLSAIDSGAALVMDKSNQAEKGHPELHVGSFDNVVITGNIHFERTKLSPSAEVGFISTLLLHPSEIAAIKDTDGFDEDGLRTGIGNGQIETTDLPAGPSGERWFLVNPIAPVISINKLSADSPIVKEQGFYDVDLSAVTFSRVATYPIAHQKNILHREDMKNIANGLPATRWINR